MALLIGAVGVHVQPVVRLKEEHVCHGPGSCTFDLGADFRDPSMRRSDLPLRGYTTEAYRWQPGDPVYTGRSS